MLQTFDTSERPGGIHGPYGGELSFDRWQEKRSPLSWKGQCIDMGLRPVASADGVEEAIHSIHDRP